MADLRITGVSNNQLELQAPDGTRHYLEITPDLLKALKTREVALPNQLSPREIQERVRHGATLEEIASSTGADVDLVARFAKPIVAELRHVVSLARSIRLSLAGDRFAEPTLVEFGSVMDERLMNNGANEIEWSAKKSVDGEWLVSISFTTSQGTGLATWSFDPKQLFLAPENETALQLSNGVPVSTVAKTVQIAQDPVADYTEPEQSVVSTPSLTVVPEIITGSESQDAESEDLFEEPTSTSPLRVVEEVIEESVEVLEITEEPLEAENINSSDEEKPIPETSVKPQASSGWAEVLFGSRDDEDENN